MHDIKVVDLKHYKTINVNPKLFTKNPENNRVKITLDMSIKEWQRVKPHVVYPHLIEATIKQ